MEPSYLELKTKFIRGFSDKTRLQILESIKEQEMTVSQIIDQVQGNQSNISQHLSCLKGCGIIIGRQQGKYIYYSLRNQKIKDMLTLLDDVFYQVKYETGQCESEIMG